MDLWLLVSPREHLFARRNVCAGIGSDCQSNRIVWNGRAADWGMTGNPEVMPQRRPHFLPSNRHPREQTRRAGLTQAEIGSYASTVKPCDLLPKHPASRPHIEHRYDRIYGWHG